MITVNSFKLLASLALLLFTPHVSSSPTALRALHKRSTPTAINPNTQPIYVGQTLTSGSVNLGFCTSNGSPGLKVTYTTVPGYLYDEVQVYVGTGFPPVNNAGNPAPGQFPYKSPGACTIAADKLSASCCIPFSSFSGGLDVCGPPPPTYYLATHSALSPAPGTTGDRETGWGGGTCFVSTCQPWSTYSTFSFVCSTTPPPPPPPPTCQGETAYANPGSNSVPVYKTFVSIGAGSNWGWQMEPTCSQLSSGISGILVAGAGGNVGGTIVGTWRAVLSGGGTSISVAVAMSTSPPHQLYTTHIYAKSVSTQATAPGRYGFTGGAGGSYVVPISGMTCGAGNMEQIVYFILHADVAVCTYTEAP